MADYSQKNSSSCKDGFFESVKFLIFALPRSHGRAVRHRSAKPSTAVRICLRPLGKSKAPVNQGLFFGPCFQYYIELIIDGEISFATIDRLTSDELWFKLDGEQFKLKAE